MAVNPMQRKSRNSMLIGLVIGLVIAAGVGALLFMKIKKLNETIDKENASKQMVYVLSKDVAAGEEIKKDMLTMASVTKTGIPANAMGASNLDEVFASVATDGKENEEKTVVAAVDLKANTVITPKLIKRTDITSDVRRAEYNMVVLPVDLVAGEYVDIRLMLPSGQDFIVVSKKSVAFPEGLNDTIWLDLSEEEILIMSSAIVEAYKITGAKLYAIKYVDSGSQEAATATYVPSGEVTTLMNSDNNIVNKASEALKARYSEGNKTLRNDYINNAVSSGTSEGVVSGMQSSVTTTKTDRKTYLESLGQRIFSSE